MLLLLFDDETPVPLIVGYSAEGYLDLIMIWHAVTFDE